jgi:N-acetylglucosaminyldiphosphoundecaprenol N-acetyl-beta-D-mannosaminyltransferase
MHSKKILNIRLHTLTNEELEKILNDWLGGNGQNMITTPNPEFLLLARHDKEFADILNHADLSLPDGFGLKLAAWLGGSSLHRHTGIDTFELLAQLAGDKPILLLGSQESAAITAKIFREKDPNLQIQAIDPGLVPESGEVETRFISEINSFAPTVLAVGLGQGKQERFIVKYLSQLPSVRIAIGVGGAFDTLSGQKPRAPRAMRRLGLEWLWRLAIEPQRWRRIANAAIVFPIVVFWDKMTKK